MKLVTPAKAGVQHGGPLDSGFRRNDGSGGSERLTLIGVNSDDMNDCGDHQHDQKGNVYDVPE